MREGGRSQGTAFLCDHMLGTLARWLRILGFDVSYPRNLEDDDVVRMASDENRILLTRDRDLGRRRGVQALYLPSDVLDEQIRQVLTQLKLSLTSPLSRCPVCNGVLDQVPKTEAKGVVPDGVYRLHEVFWKCPECGKFYWQGTHWDRMSKKVEEYAAMTSSDSP